MKFRKTALCLALLAALCLFLLPGCDETAAFTCTVAPSVPADQFPAKVLDFARDYVISRATLLEEDKCPVAAAELNGLFQVNTGTVGNWDGVNMYEIAYAIEAKDPAKIPADCTLDADGRVTARGDGGVEYMLLYFKEDGEVTHWSLLAMLTESEIERDYNTPEMLEKYGNPYTAACMEKLEASRAEP